MASKTRTIDPVCGMEVEPGTAIAVEYAGMRYYFCERVCAGTFREDPQRWVRPEDKRPPSAVNS